MKKQWKQFSVCAHLWPFISLLPFISFCISVKWSWLWNGKTFGLRFGIFRKVRGITIFKKKKKHKLAAIWLSKLRFCEVFFPYFFRKALYLGDLTFFPNSFYWFWKASWRPFQQAQKQTNPTTGSEVSHFTLLPSDHQSENFEPAAISHLFIFGHGPSGLFFKKWAKEYAGKISAELPETPCISKMLVNIHFMTL